MKVSIDPRHGHCDTCDRCAQDDGAAGSRIRAVSNTQLRAVGWTVNGDRVGCPEHPVSGR